MYGDPYGYYQRFQETCIMLKQALPEAHEQAIREYILKRINTSQWSSDHVMSVIQAQSRLGAFIYEEGDVKLPPEFPAEWVDAPIVGFIEITNTYQVTTKGSKALLARGIFVEHYSPWYIKYPARVKRWLRAALRWLLKR